MTRRMMDLCQDCWQDVNPGDYAPASHTQGECQSCGSEGLTYRTALTPPIPPTCVGMKVYNDEDADFMAWRNANIPGGE